MPAKRVDFVFPLAIFAAISAVYLSFISSGYHYDSIMLAQFAESGSFFIYGWRQHSFLILINTLFYRLWSLFSPGQSALFPLAFLGCLAGSLGVVIFFLTLKELFSSRSLALFGALGLAFSYNYWRYSTLVETHIIPTLFLITAVYFLARLKSNATKINLIFSGFFAALSVLSSEANIVFLPALLIFLFYTISSRAKRNSAVILYLAVFSCCWFIPYLLLGLFVFLKEIVLKHQPYSLGPVKSLILWFRSEIYTIPFQSSNLIVMAERSISSVFILSNKFASLILIYLGGGLFFISKRKDFARNHLNIMLAAFMAALFFFLTLLFYEPFNLQRYTPFLIFVWLFICVLLKDLFLKDTTLYKSLVIFIIVIFIFINNLIFSVLPDTKPENNLSLQAALLVKESTSESDIVIERGGEFWSNGTIWPTGTTKYIPYFAQRKLISFLEIESQSRKTSDDAELLKFKQEIDQAINSGRRVIVFQNALAINSQDSGFVYPVIYFKIANLLQSEYKLTKYREKSRVVIYRLDRKES